MNAFEAEDYRGALKARVSGLKAAGKPMTWRRVAEKIPVQYTFLSKCMNDEKTHLSEDHLFRVCELLDFLPEETEFVLLLRARAVCSVPSRREFLTRLIEKQRKQRVVRAEHRGEGAMTDEMEYLLDPIASLVKSSLFLKEMRRAPLRLASLLGLTPQRLRRILDRLENLGFIEVGERDEVVSYNRRPQHWGRQHPLMRAHQMAMKLHMLDRLRATDEADKESFFVTFTMDEEGFLEVKKLVQDTLKEIQRITEKGKHTGVYQFSLDFLKVFSSRP